VPCKKQFSRRWKLDAHNRVVHDIEVTYNCRDCHKAFSRRDRLATHMKYGKCVAVPAERTEPSSATDAQLSVVGDDPELPDELSML